MPPKSPKIADASSSTRSAAWIQGGALENAGSKAASPIKPKADVGADVRRARQAGRAAADAAEPLRTEPVVTHQQGRTRSSALAASPWAPLVAVGGQKQVLLYHGDTLRPARRPAVPGGHADVLKFSRNGALLLAGGGRGGQVGQGGRLEREDGRARSSRSATSTTPSWPPTSSADQTQIALGGPARWSASTRRRTASCVREVKKHTDWITAVEFSPDGVLLATADRTGGLFVWEAATGREYFDLRGHTAAITDVSWRDDSNVLASASEDTTIKLWEMENGGQIKNWGAHGGGAQAVKFSHDNRLVSTGRDRVTKVWDMNGTNTKAFPAHAGRGPAGGVQPRQHARSTPATGRGPCRRSTWPTPSCWPRPRPTR